jgi:thiamine biosynthesis lipoprotein
VQNFVLNIGGEIIFRGEREKNKSWVAGIETPDENLEGDVQLAFKIKDLALATSGSYRQFRLDKGKKNSHIINPFTHHPHQSDIVSASVLAETAGQADAWSTAMMILGEKGFPQAEKFGLKVMLIQKTPQGNFKQILSPSLKEYLGINKL